MTIEAMPFVSSHSSRLAITSGETGTRIEIAAKKNVFFLAVIIMIFAVWSYCSQMIVGFLSDVPTDVPPLMLFMSLWTVLWTAGWFVLAGGILWMLFGRETIELTDTALVRTLALAGLRYRRAYDAALVRDVRRHDLARRPNVADAAWIPFTGAATVVFDYGERTVEFDSGLDRGGANTVIAALRSQIDKTAGGVHAE